MFTTQLRRYAALCALACTLALPAPALAVPIDRGSYHSSYGDPAMTSALAQEHYYGSYPGPDTRPAPHAPDNGSPLPIIALSIGGSLVLVAAGLAGLQRNTRRHRRVAA